MSRALTQTTTEPAQPRPVDSLALFTAALGVYGLFVFTANVTSAPSGFWLIGPLGALLILWPRSTALMMSFLGLFVIDYLWRSPVRSNNQTVTFFTGLVCVCVYVGYRLRARGAPINRQTLFAAFSGPARWVVAVLYLYGIFHKINVDFLDPEVSCASVLFDRLARWVALDGWTPGHYVAIYSTFVFEGLAMILLLTKRYKLWGFVIGLPFHIIIGFTGYAFYMDFSTLAIALYLLQIPDEVTTELNTRILARRPARAHPDGFWPHYRLFMFKALVVAIAVVVGLRLAGLDRIWSMVLPFAVYSAVIYLGVLRLALWRKWQPLRPTPGWSWAWAGWVPVLFLLNGLSPYLGLKTESSIAMFSNLHTEGGVTNHLVITEPWDVFGYQRDLLKVVKIDDERLARRYATREITRYELDRLRAEGAVVEFAPGTGVEAVSAPGENTYLDTPWLARKFLVFKPVDWARPKACSH